MGKQVTITAKARGGGGVKNTTNFNIDGDANTFATVKAFVRQVMGANGDQEASIYTAAQALAMSIEGHGPEAISFPNVRFEIAVTDAPANVGQGYAATVAETNAQTVYKVLTEHKSTPRSERADRICQALGLDPTGYSLEDLYDEDDDSPYED